MPPAGAAGGLRPGFDGARRCPARRARGAPPAVPQGRAPVPDPAIGNRLHAELTPSELEDPMQAHLTEAMGHMTPVDRVTLTGMICAFAEEPENVGQPMSRGFIVVVNTLGERGSDVRRAARRSGSRQSICFSRNGFLGVIPP